MTASRKFLIFMVVMYFVILGSLVYGQGETGEALFGRYTIKHEKTYGDDGIQYFTLASPVGSFLISADANTEVGKWLVARDGKALRITFEGLKTERLER